jgi:phosphate butyryltransferase
MTIASFDQLLSEAALRGPKRVAIVGADQRQTLAAITKAHEANLAESVLIGDTTRMRRIVREEGLTLPPAEIITEADTRRAAEIAVQLVNEARVDLVMNGRALPVDLMVAALDREKGLRLGRLISDVSVFEIPGFERLVFVSDMAIVVSPNLAQKAAIVQNAVGVAQELGIETPRVAILAATEMVNPDLPANLDAANLAKMGDRGQIRNAIIDGPLAMDNAISLEAAERKGIRSPVAGRADILIAPDVESANILAKAIVYFAKGKMAGVVVGAKCPLVMPSRSDPPEQKLVSLALGVYLAR